METRTWSLKIIIIGEPSVGKTSLRRSYLGDKFRISYIATIGADFSFKQLHLHNKDLVNISIWDLAGQVRFQNVHPQYYRGSAGALVVYDVSNRDSFNSIQNWIEKYQALTGEHKCPILIVGNKIDLLKESQTEIISEEEQSELVEKLLGDFENKFPIISARTSAKVGTEINESFTRLVENIINWQQNRVRINDLSANLQVEDVIKAAYILTFHDVTGPKIIIKDPNSSAPYSDQEFSSTIKITSTLDFEDVLENSQITGSNPWMDPKGTFYFIAFSMENPSARGSQSLFLIGFVTSRDLREIISQSQHIIDGFLHSTLNEFVHLIQMKTLDLTSEEGTELTEDVKIEGHKILFRLRTRIFNAIKSSLF